MKTTKILYWIFTGLVFAFESVMPALTFNSEMAKQGISDLGYPDYFRIALTIFKVVGGLILILPFFKGRIKEWAYAGLFFDLFGATYSAIAQFGLKPGMSFMILLMVFLFLSYWLWHKKSTPSIA